jgi:hypothetical protein
MTSAGDKQTFTQETLRQEGTAPDATKRVPAQPLELGVLTHVGLEAEAC